MIPKKKSHLYILVYIFGFTVAAILGLQIAAAADIAGDDSTVLMNEIVSRLNNPLQDIYWTDSSGGVVTWCCGIWLVAILALENKKRNTIKGKEYGTARWGNQNDVKDLFAANVAKAEMKKAKQVTTPWGRWKAKRKARKTAVANCRAEERQRIENISPMLSRREKNQEVKRIKAETSQKVKEAKTKAWTPDRLDLEYEQAKKEIPVEVEEEKTYELSLIGPMYDDASRKLKEEAIEKDKQAELKTRLAAAKEYHDIQLKEFYSVNNRILKIKDKYADADMLLTKTERVSLYQYQLNQNILIFGGSGAGKSRGFAMPNILQAHSSYVIADPKGEILEKSGYFLQIVKGYKIRVLNLDDKTESDYYNPFVYIHPERKGYEERVLSLIETIILNTEAGEASNSGDPFWPKAERLFLQAIFFFTIDGFIPEERNMNTVLKLIQMLEIGEEDDNKDSDLDLFAEAFEENFGSGHIGVQQYREFRGKAAGKTAKSIVISAVARLAPFRVEEVRRIFGNCDNMELDRVGEEKMALFVITPPTDRTFQFMAGMLFTQLFQELQYCATQVHKHKGQRLPIPVRFILDEFYNIGKIPNFPSLLSYARSFGIGIVPILQSISQLKAMYEKEWGVIVDNCNSLLFLGSISEQESLDWMSKMLGKATFDKQSFGRTLGSKGSSSTNDDVIGRDLMDAAEIRKIDKQHCILLLGGRPPFFSEKYNYEDHPNYRYTSDANKALSYTYTPAPPKVIEDKYHQIDEIAKEIRGSLDHLEQAKKVDDPTAMLQDLSRGYDKFAPLPDEAFPENEISDEAEIERLLYGDTFDEDTFSFVDSVLSKVERAQKVDEPEQIIKDIKENVDTLAPQPDENYPEEERLTDVEFEEMFQTLEEEDVPEIEIEGTEAEDLGSEIPDKDLVF